MMVKHVVMWKLKAFAEGNDKETNLVLLKEKIESLREVIPEIQHLEVGINFQPSDQAFDVVLVSEFENREALERYRNHPEHVKVAEFVAKVRSDRNEVDYEL
jgi:hypothetical protein